jgi:hypothetical protein
VSKWRDDTSRYVQRRHEGERKDPFEKSRAEYKWYAPGIGMVKEGEFVLVRRDSPN